MSEYAGTAGVGWFAIIWSNRDMGAGWLEAGRKVTPEETGLDGTFGDGRNDDVVTLAGAGAAGRLGDGRNDDVVGAAAGRLGDGRNDDVVTLAGAAAFGALKGEAADVVPRIAGAEGGVIPKPIFIGPELGVFPRTVGWRTTGWETVGWRTGVLLTRLLAARAFRSAC